MSIHTITSSRSPIEGADAPRATRERGAALVEFGLVVPIFVTLILGVFTLVNVAAVRIAMRESGADGGQRGRGVIGAAIAGALLCGALAVWELVGLADDLVG